MNHRLHTHGAIEPMTSDNGFPQGTIVYGSSLSGHATQLDRSNEDCTFILGLENKNRSLSVKVLVASRCIDMETCGIKTSLGDYEWHMKKDELCATFALHGDEAHRFMWEMSRVEAVRVSIGASEGDVIVGHFSGKDMVQTPIQWILERKSGHSITQSAAIFKQRFYARSINLLGRIAPYMTAVLTKLTGWLIRRETLATVAVALFFFPFLPLWVALEFASVPMAILQFAGVDIGTTGLVGQIVSALMFPFTLLAVIKWMLRQRDSNTIGRASGK